MGFEETVIDADFYLLFFILMMAAFVLLMTIIIYGFKKLEE